MPREPQLTEPGSLELHPAFLVKPQVLLSQKQTGKKLFKMRNACFLPHTESGTGGVTGSAPGKAVPDTASPPAANAGSHTEGYTPEAPRWYLDGAGCWKDLHQTQGGSWSRSGSCWGFVMAEWQARCPWGIMADHDAQATSASLRVTVHP